MSFTSVTKSIQQKYYIHKVTVVLLIFTYNIMHITFQYKYNKLKNTTN